VNKRQASIGTNDILTWRKFAGAAHEQGLVAAYRSVPELNHPPLPILWAAASLRIADATGVRFPFVFRLPSVLADVVSCVLLAHVWRRRVARGEAPRAAPVRAVTAMALSPVAILIGAYHGNTDNVYAALSLLAAFALADLRRPFVAGLSLAGAMNVKLIPIVLVLPLAACCPSIGGVIVFGAGLAVGAIPLLVMMALAGGAFVRNVLSYTAQRDRWGLTYALSLLQENATPAGRRIGDAIARGYYHVWGRWMVLGATAVLAAVQHFRRKDSRGAGDAYELAAVAAAVMLLVIPGFGIQYLAFAAPLLLACSVGWGTAYNVLAGSFLLVAYAMFGFSGWPVFTWFNALIPTPAALIGAATWVLLLCFAAARVWRLFDGSSRAAYEAPASPLADRAMIGR
jgi:hypothetical protein